MAATLSLRPPYNFHDSIRFWRRSTAELTEQWSGGVYRRLLPTSSGAVLLSVHSVGTPDDPAVTLSLDGTEPDDAMLAAYAPTIQRVLNADLDTAAAETTLSAMPELAPLVRRYRGLRPPRPQSIWEALVWAICAQQISLGFALILKERLVRRYGDTRQVDGRPLSTFPSTPALAVADPAELRSFQFSGSKAGFIVGLAQAIEEGRLDLSLVESLPTTEALAYLMSFRGIGRWTAEYTLLRGLGRADAFPAADAGVRQALVRLGAVPPRPAEAELRAWADRLYPWGGVAALYLWRWLADG